MNKLNFFCAQLFRANAGTLFLSRRILRNVSKSNQYFSTSLAFSSQNISSEHLPNKNGLIKRSLQDLTPEEEKKLKVLKLELDVFFSTGVRVPSVMTDENWLFVLQHCEGFFRRKSYYGNLYKIEKATLHKKEKALANIKFHEEKDMELKRLVAEGLIQNFKNRILLLLVEKTVNTYYYNNIFWQMANGGQRLVFDFSFGEHMNIKELTDLVKQVHTSHGQNKLAKEPFIFHFCNLDPDSVTNVKLKTAMANLDVAPILVSTDSYLNHYPKDKLVYLCPNATENLTYDPDDVYIIGSLVDKRVETPLTLAKAKREGLRMAKFPLDRYVKWAQGSKALPLNQVVSILEKIKAKQGWVEALSSSLPSRKYTSISEELVKTETKFKNKSFKSRPRRSLSF